VIEPELMYQILLPRDSSRRTSNCVSAITDYLIGFTYSSMPPKVADLGGHLEAIAHTPETTATRRRYQSRTTLLCNYCLGWREPLGIHPQDGIPSLESLYQTLRHPDLQLNSPEFLGTVSSHSNCSTATTCGSGDGKPLRDRRPAKNRVGT